MTSKGCLSATPCSCSVRDLDARQHADDAVVAAAAQHGVAVRAGDDGLARGVAAGARADQVAAGIQPRGKAGGLELLAQPGARLIEQRREGAPRPGLAGQGVAGQGFDAGPQTLGVQRRKGGGGVTGMRLQMTLGRLWHAGPRRRARAWADAWTSGRARHQPQALARPALHHQHRHHGQADRQPAPDAHAAPAGLEASQAPLGRPTPQ